MTDFSFSLTTGGFYPIVSECCCSALQRITSCSFKSVSNDVLRNGLVAVDFRDNEKTYGEVRDLTMDCLLLGYLPPPPLVSIMLNTDTIIAHLVADDCHSKPLDKPYHDLGVLSLVREPSYGTLCQQFPGYFFDFFECAATTVGSDRRYNLSMHVRSQPPASIRLLGVSIDCCRGDVLFEPIQLG